MGESTRETYRWFVKLDGYVGSERRYTITGLELSGTEDEILSQVAERYGDYTSVRLFRVRAPQYEEVLLTRRSSP